MNNKIYPIGIQNFEKIRNNGYAYVDKTALIYQLVKSGSYYFLSRPRRFGKSVLLSTLEAYFQGKQKLFKGLAMERLEQDWGMNPVLHLDLNIGKYDAPDSLSKVLNNSLTIWESLYEICPTETTLALRFAGIIKRAAEKTGHRVAILIDEYNKPLLQAITDETLQREYRQTLKSFYSVLKTMDDCIKFALLTGVTKLGKANILGDLDYLNDISMDESFVSLCGITEKEMQANFAGKLHELAETQDMTYEDTYQKWKLRYDGYHFNKNTESIYNPFSMLSAFYKMKFGNYCFETGAPTYLIELLKRNHCNLEQLLHEEVSADVLNDDQLLSTFFQSGCFTIKGYDSTSELYRLGFPNQEIEEGFFKLLMPFYTRFNKLEAPAEIMRFVRDVERGQSEAFLRRLQSFFIGMHHEPSQNTEQQCRNLLFIIFKLSSFCLQAEYHTFEGGMNMLLKTADCIYILEFKIDGTAEEAIQQIEEKQYATSFKTDSRPLFKIGLNISSKTHGIGRWVVLPSRS